MIPIGIGFAMSSYETAFSAAVKIDEKGRAGISVLSRSMAVWRLA